MTTRRRVISVLMHLSTEQAADGEIVGAVEAVDTGQGQTVESSDDLRAWLQREAYRRLDRGDGGDPTHRTGGG